MKTNEMTNKKTVTRILTVTVLYVSVIFLFYFVIATDTLSSYETQTVVTTEPRVYITTYGNCYHNIHYSYLYKSQIPIGKQQAINNGYYACSRCGGHSSGTIKVTYTKRATISEYHSSTNIAYIILLFTLLPLFHHTISSNDNPFIFFKEL